MAAELFLSGDFSGCKELLLAQLPSADPADRHQLHLNIACCEYELSLYRCLLPHFSRRSRDRGGL